MAMTLAQLEAFSETKPEKRFLTEEIIKYLVANPGAALPGNVTLQGNTFNGNSELVQTESDGKLPAIDGSQLTNLPGGAQTLEEVLIQGNALTVDRDVIIPDVALRFIGNTIQCRLGDADKQVSLIILNPFGTSANLTLDASNNSHGSAYLSATNNLSETLTIEVNSERKTINISQCAEFSDNAAAITGGLIAGDVYRTGDDLKIVHA